MKASDLPAYNPTARCPKCHGDNIGVHHCDGRRCTEALLGEPGWPWREQHFHRNCRRCHYEWAERVLGRDAKVEEGPPPDFGQANVTADHKGVCDGDEVFLPVVRNSHADIEGGHVIVRAKVDTSFFPISHTYASRERALARAEAMRADRELIARILPDPSPKKGAAQRNGSR